MSYISKEHELQPGEEVPTMDTVTVKSMEPVEPIVPLYKSTQADQTSPRPKINDPQVIALFCKLFAVEMRTSCDSLCVGMSLEDIEHGLIKCGIPDSNGYEYAKNLENYGRFYGITADDVEVMDNAHSFLRDAHDDLVIQWINDNNVQPDFNDGDLCSYKGETGTVHWCDRLMRTGEYLFRSVKWISEHGDQDGRYVKWEEVKA